MGVAQKIIIIKKCLKLLRFYGNQFSLMSTISKHIPGVYGGGGGCNYMGFVRLHGGLRYIQTYTWSLGGGCTYMGSVRLYGGIRYLQTSTWSLWGGGMQLYGVCAVTWRNTVHPNIYLEFMGGGGGCTYIGSVHLHGGIWYLQTYTHIPGVYGWGGMLLYGVCAVTWRNTVSPNIYLEFMGRGAVIWGLCGYMEEYGISKHIPGVYGGGGCTYMGSVRLHGGIWYLQTSTWSLWGGGDAIIWGLCGYMEEYGTSKHIPGVYGGVHFLGVCAFTWRNTVSPNIYLESMGRGALI